MYPHYRRTAEDRMTSVLKGCLWLAVAIVGTGVVLVVYVLAQAARLLTSL